MRKPHVVVVFIVGVVCVARADGPRGIESVAWLQGCWELSAPDRSVEEQWMAPRGRTMLGVSRTVRGGSLSDYELVVIRERGEQLTYEARPAGQAAATFVSRATTASTVVFENLEHDFPQRIGYERKGANLLTAWIEGPQKGQTRRIEFPYKRVACAGE